MTDNEEQYFACLVIRMPIISVMILASAEVVLCAQLTVRLAIHSLIEHVTVVQQRPVKKVTALSLHFIGCKSGLKLTPLVTLGFYCSPPT